MQFGSHLLGDAEPPVPYSSVPPSSGWHASGAPPMGVHDQPLSEPVQVLALEAGGVVVTYNDIPDADLASLSGSATDVHTGQVVTTPYERIPAGTVVLASWGALQRCDGLDLTALDAFVAAYGNDIGDFVDPTG